MGTSTVIERISAEDLLRRPNDGYRYDLIEGELRKMWPAGFHHGTVASYIHVMLGSYVLQHEHGVLTSAETGFLLSTNPDTMLAPDIGFVASANIPAERITRGFFPGAPDLAIEVTSPGNTSGEMDEKIAKYLEYGTRMVWIVRPLTKLVEVHRTNGAVSLLREGDALDGEDVVPGFSLPLEQVFR